MIMFTPIQSLLPSQFIGNAVNVSFYVGMAAQEATQVRPSQKRLWRKTAVPGQQGMSSLLATGGPPKKLVQLPTNVKHVVFEIYGCLKLDYSGVRSEDGFLAIGISAKQLVSRRSPEADKSLGVWSTWISSNPRNHQAWEDVLRREQTASMAFNYERPTSLTNYTRSVHISDTDQKETMIPGVWAVQIVGATSHDLFLMMKVMFDNVFKDWDIDKNARLWTKNIQRPDGSHWVDAMDQTFAPRGVFKASDIKAMLAFVEQVPALRWDGSAACAAEALGTPSSYPFEAQSEEEIMFYLKRREGAIAADLNGGVEDKRLLNSSPPGPRSPTGQDVRSDTKAGISSSMPAPTTPTGQKRDLDAQAGMPPFARVRTSPPADDGMKCEAQNDRSHTETVTHTETVISSSMPAPHTPTGQKRHLVAEPGMPSPTRARMSSPADGCIKCEPVAADCPTTATSAIVADKIVAFTERRVAEALDGKRALVDKGLWQELVQLEARVGAMKNACDQAVEVSKDRLGDLVPCMLQLLKVTGIDPESSEGLAMQALATPAGIFSAPPETIIKSSI